jgi:hypothetical protein
LIRHQALLDNPIERGTQHVCLRTQWVDLIVIAGLPVTLFVLHLMRAKAHRGEPGWPRLAPWLAMLGPGIATADVWESLVTRTMLGASTSFPSGLASPGSSLSAVTWGWSVIGTSLVVKQPAAPAWHGFGSGRAARLARHPS